jgi:hypothetical protein
MGYIARTDGGQSVLELRQGVLTDIPAAARGNWRAVTEVTPAIDNFSQIRTVPAFAVSADGTLVSMTWQSVNLPTVWLQMRLKDYTANLRWQKQQLPMTLPDGTIIDATEASKTKIDQALRVLEKGWTASIDFKAENGWITVDLAALTTVAQALVSREQALFTTEKAIEAAIDAGSVTTTAGVDGWSWP